MTSNGAVVIPTKMRTSLNLRGGDKLIARAVDGVIVLEPLDAAIHRAQVMVGRYVPAGAGLVDELLAERRAAAKP